VKVVTLAGGVGGAKLASGLSGVLPPEDLTVVVNTGDDFEHLGLHISPDIDTVVYTLAGIANPETGWGIAGDTFAVLEALGRMGQETWFRIGDRDFATHLQRTALLRGGLNLTQATERIRSALGASQHVVPMSDDPVATRVVTDEGELDFQDYFVRRACEPAVKSIRFQGIESANPSPAAVAALEESDAILIAPSNPFVSIEPILSLPGMRRLVASKPAVAVSPIVGGRALKGPAAKLLAELGHAVTPIAVAEGYADCLGGFAIDAEDALLADGIRGMGFEVLVSQTIMRSDADRAALAKACLDLARSLRPKAAS
jgi:LPPG:FO 2-phospho-L-lactate transferase